MYRVADEGAARRGEHGAPDACPPGGVEHLKCAEDVDVEVRRRVRHRHHDRACSREVHDRLDPDEGVVHCLCIADVAFDEFRLHPFEVGGVSRREIVEHPHGVPALYESSHQCRSDEAGAPGYENPLLLSHPRPRREVSRRPAPCPNRARRTSRPPLGRGGHALAPEAGFHHVEGLLDGCSTAPRMLGRLLAPDTRPPRQRRGGTLAGIFRPWWPEQARGRAPDGPITTFTRRGRGNDAPRGMALSDPPMPMGTTATPARRAR